MTNRLSPLNRRGLLSLLLSGLAAKTTARTQTFSSNLRVINISASVRDSAGTIQRSLSRERFVLEVDGRPRAIEYFSGPSDLPVNVAVLIDSSGSMQASSNEEIIASKLLVGELLKNKQNRVCIYSFADKVVLKQSLNSSAERFILALNRLGRETVADGDTNLFDAITEASLGTLNTQYGRRAILVLSDGIDTGSRVSLKGAIEAAQEADVVVYAICLTDPSLSSGWTRLQDQLKQKREEGLASLQVISQRTGGKTYPPGSSTKLIYQEMKEELENQYSLGFHLTDEFSAPGSHKLRIALRDPGYTVQAKDSYHLRP